MLFSSITFLYFFLPLTVLLYYFVSDKAKNLVLFVMSVIFYAWGEPVYVFLMLAEILAAYMLTMLMQRWGSRADKALCALSVTAPFMLLFYYKFSPSLPIGISFYTFQLVSYCIDVYKGRVKCQRSIIKLAAYVTLFPQLVAGPIVRYEDVEEVLDGKQKRDENDILAGLEQGMVRFLTGLSKKVLIANLLGEFVSEVSAVAHSQRGFVMAWAYAAAVSLQLYFDFSGYSDMAIGLGRMFGFKFPENFNYPFMSKSVSEFWRRWHMTLGSWFRDYVYIPLGGNRKGNVRWLVNILTVWLFTGLWHGAEWNFILWGLSFAVLLVIEKAVRSVVKINCFALTLIRHIYMIAVICMTFLLFHNTELSVAVKDISGLWHVSDSEVILSADNVYILRNRIGILLIAIIGATPVPKRLWESIYSNVYQKQGGFILLKFLEISYALVLLLLCTSYLIDGSFNPFLYFRF